MSKRYIVETNTAIEIPFHDMDIMEVVWHGHYVKYFEIARCTLLEKITYDYPQMRESGYAWPVIDLHLRYTKPATYGDHLKVNAGLLEYENRLKIEYRIENANTNQTLTKGHTVQVAFNMKTKEMELVSPDVLRVKLEAYL